MKIRSTTFLVLVLLSAVTQAQEPPATKAAAASPHEDHRKPAEVMSYLGANWLERPEREAEERPDDVIAAMELKAGDNVADIGVGTGYFARRIAKKVAPGGVVYGVDVQPEMLDYLKEYCEKDGIENVKPILSSATTTNLPDASVDWMILADVYHEFEDPKAMLADMHRALKPGGKVALLEYRLLGDTAKHIKPEHRMSVKQVLAEWSPAGFELIDLLDFLPSQHYFIFRRRD